MNYHLSGEEVFIVTVVKCYSNFVYTSFPLGFEARIWGQIALVLFPFIAYPFTLSAKSLMH